MGFDVSRRGFAGLLGALPFVGGTAVSALKGMGASAVGQVGVAAQGLALGGVPIGYDPNCTGATYSTPVPQRMSHAQALASFFSNKDYLSKLESSLFEEQILCIPIIDPDIRAFKSFSENAKITFQRQRNVKRGLERIKNYENRADSWWQEKIHKLMWG